MINNKTVCSIMIFYLMLLLLIINGCKEPVSLQSKWLDKKIVIDANDIDWKDYPFFYDEDTLSCIGLYNDDKNLYLYFQTMDEKIQQQILRRGLYIWFNKTGGKDKELALCFPRGGGFGGPGGPPDMSSGMSGTSIDKSEDSNMPARRPFSRDVMRDSRVKIMTSEDDRGYNCSVERAARMGIEVSCRIDQRKRFVYELKMPLVETAKTVFIAEVSSTNSMGIGFVTTKMGKGDMVRGGPGRGMGSGPGGGPGVGKGGKAGALEIWTNVTLASKPAHTN